MEEPVSPLAQACTLPLLRTGGFLSPASSASTGLLETGSKSASSSAPTRGARSSRVPLPSSWFDEEALGSSHRSPPAAAKTFCDEVFTPPQAMMRRTMAAVAGGGFRGPQVAAPKACMCETLKARLAKAQAELRELRSGSKGKRSSTPLLLEGVSRAVEHQGVQTEASAFPPSPIPPVPPPRRTAEAGTQYKPPTDHAGTQTEAPALASAREIGAQTDELKLAETREVECQVEVRTGHQLVQTDEAPRRASKEMSVQTAAMDTPTPTKETVEAATQVLAPALCAAELQAGCPFGELREVSMQTEAQDVTTAEAAVMTVPEPRREDASTNTDKDEEEKEEKKTEEAERQPDEHEEEPQRKRSEEEPPTKSAPVTASAACQTTLPLTAGRGVQASPSPGVAVAVQFDDPSEVARNSERLQALRDNEELRQGMNQLGGRLESIQAELSKWRSAAQSQLLSRINITILCPRAECMVNSTRLSMDSWDPERLKKEFEKEVLPRFSKLFINEEDGDSQGESQTAQMALVERTMQEFADCFRQRLTAILSAPNAAAAVSASGV